MQSERRTGGVDYRQTGVDLDEAERAKEGLRELIARTRDVHTLSELGSFGGLYAVPENIEAPVLVSSADGVGTKLKVAFATGRHDSIGQDLVNHCVNDILVQGARPLFFLDYLATGRLDARVVQDVVRGVAQACQENSCALLGGETAQMPDFYSAGEYDLAGFIVGIVPRAQLIDGGRIQAGDQLLGLASAGLHTNGYSLARHVAFERAGLSVDDLLPGTEETVGAALLRVHRSYRVALLPEVERGTLKGLAHITGGGIPGNLPRVLPAGLGAQVDSTTWRVPHLFEWLEAEGGIDRAEMFRVFNMGVGMIAVVGQDDVEAVSERLRAAGEDVWVCGSVVEGSGVEIVP
ncbi:MAG: phosphoribosylformylglycinamidine cyclo-ligase [Gemmatimonadota bacterium]